MDVVQISLLAITGVIAALAVKSCKPEYGMYIALVVCLVIGGGIASCFAEITRVIGGLQEYLPGMEDALSVLLKAVGATYACELCAGICRDAGYAGVAGQVEMAGKLYVLLLGMPILMALLDCIQNLGY